MKHIHLVMVVAPEQFNDTEYFTPKDIFEHAGFTVTTASAGSHATSKNGMMVPTIPFHELPAVTDGIVMIGGGGARVYFDNPTVHTLLHDYASASKLVSAICISPVTLAHAGLLKEKKATVYPSGVDDVKKFGAVHVDAPVVVDGNIITGKNPDAAMEFGKTIVEYFLT